MNNINFDDICGFKRFINDFFRARAVNKARTSRVEFLFVNKTTNIFSAIKQVQKSISYSFTKEI